MTHIHKCLGCFLVLGVFFMAPKTISAIEGLNTQSLITSWNVCSKQFIDPPVFRLLPLPETALYQAEVKQGQHAWTVSSKEPSLDLKKIWKHLAVRKFDLKLRWLDRDGKAIREESSTRVKAPDFKGFNEAPLDWAAAADRNIAYLIWAADHGKTPYREPGVPVWIWSSAPGYPVGYPALNLNFFIWAFLAHREHNGPNSDEAFRLARITADWTLKNHTPDSGALPRFPYSSITDGKMSGGVDGEGLNLLRASWFASSYVDLYAITHHQPYLDYARHIADTTLKFQNPDGSFPYRIHPKTGAVLEMYNSNVGEFLELVDKLEAHGFDSKRAMAARRAAEWALSYVCTTHNWKAVFEDVTPGGMYQNLTGMSCESFIRYLCRHKDEDSSYLPAAKQLNRWVEDQFVTFGIENETLPVREKGVLVFEQYNCWAPMDSHTGNWIMSLIELHKATGENQYLEKAMAAANAICFDQYPDGQFSTWGRNWDDRRTAVENIPEEAGSNNWYAGNACATLGLYKLVRYLEEKNEQKMPQ